MQRIPFSESELVVKGEYKSAWAGFPGTPILSTPIPAGEHFVNTMIKKQTPLWLPMSSDYVTIIPRMIPDNRARALVFDAVPLTDEEKGGADMFGINWVFVPVAGGSMVQPGAPLLSDANEWKEKLVWPNIDEWDWAQSAESNKDYLAGERAVNCWIMNGFYERLISFMDFEGAIVALIDDDQKDAVHSLFTKLCELYERIIDKFIEYYGMNQLLFHDDWGSQRAPFFSLETCEEMVAPYIRRIADYCHSKGCAFELHSCGSNGLLVPAMINAHVDVWSPMANINDVPALYEKYGDQIHFGYSAPMLPPDATLEQKEDAAKAYVEKFCKPDKWVVGGSFDPTLRELIYKYSRIALNK